MNTLHRLAAVVAVAILAAGCGSDTGPDDTALPTLEPVAVSTPSPTPAPVTYPPVAGERVQIAIDVGDGTVNGADDREAVDEDAIRGFASAVLDWLDRHLTDLQDGGGGLLAEVAAPGLPTQGDLPAALQLLPSGIRVDTARYELTAYHDTAVEFVTVAVAVDAMSGEHAEATLVFAPGDAGPPQLVMADDAVPAAEGDQ